MPSVSRLSLLPAAAMLLFGTPFALAESPMPDPIAPAVIGRPLDQIVPAQRARPKARPAKVAAAQQPAANPRATSERVAKPAAAATVLGAAPATLDAAGAQRPPKQAVDDRAGSGIALPDVGQGTRLGRKPLAEGAYFAARHRHAARTYYAQNPVMRPPVHWKIGEPVPPGAVVTLPPRGLLAALPQVPPGHQYVELGGDVVLIAAQSRMVVDGISRGRTETAQLSR